MNIIEKKAMLDELYKIPEFQRSDQEIEEIARLQEEIKLELQESVQEPKQTSQVQPKKYRGIISGRIEAWRDKRREANKATPEMIRQLRLEAEKEELKAKISKSKKVQKDNKTSRFDFHIPGKIFTETDEKQYKSYKKKISGDDKDYSVLGI